MYTITFQMENAVETAYDFERFKYLGIGFCEFGTIAEWHHVAHDEISSALRYLEQNILKMNSYIGIYEEEKFGNKYEIAELICGITATI